MTDQKSSPAVVKVSGSLLDEPDALADLWPEVRALHGEAPVVLVHGGGAQMTALANRLGHTPERVQGRRVTGDLDLEIAQWTMGGALNTKLVSQAQQHDLRAIGLSGADAELIQVSKRPPWTINGHTVDFGWVGDIEAIHSDMLEVLLTQSLVPVVAPLGIDDDGQIYNVNADTVACALAEALAAETLFFVTGAGAVRRDADDPSSRLDTCDTATAQRGVADGWIEGGMRVKVETALSALAGAVGDVHICGPDDLLSRSQATEVVVGT
ncbi:acetylglutamate kinase [Salinibacter altiplanensis]|uniref:acetylglutamate kinase n=1 Tax=Salinibacter altiplanensis TaxID=1803181 RepID=UPI000C9FF02F|nr:acetylglutamate kinase [Salinibacter altiplanensis]